MNYYVILFTEDNQMKCAQIMDVKSTVQDQVNAINSLKQQIDVLRTEKLNLQRDIEQLHHELEDCKNRLRVRISIS